MTQDWGDAWNVTINASTNWRVPYLRPYMRLLVVSDVKVNMGSWQLQRCTSEFGRKAHKVIFSDDTGAPGFDIADWAITHIGVPFMMKDREDKFPYEFLDCSALVTATRIQSLYPNTNHNYRICYINGESYLRGEYVWNQSTYSTNTEIVSLNEDPNIGRGYILSIRYVNSTDTYRNDHMGIVYNLRYDQENEVIISCETINSMGNNGPIEGRTRFDDFVIKYPERYFIYTFMRWTN